MTTDKQKICKCGVNVAEFLSNTRILEKYVRTANVENSSIYIPAFKSSIDSIYRDINKIEDDCGIDANKIKWSHADIFSKLEKIGAIKDPKQFDEKKEYIFRDLDKIAYDVVEKVKECSK